MNIRLETKNDHFAVEALTREAFWNIYRPGCTEHYVLHQLRQSDCFIPELDYVIEENGRIIAHIVYAKAQVRSPEDRIHDVAIFGPVSVLPEMQDMDYGTAIITHTLALAKDMGIPMILITGNPAYYHRFGFVSASELGITYEGMDPAEEAPFFMGKVLDETAAGEIRGSYADPPVYFVDDREVEEFDKQFPPKVKEKLPGQLE